MLAAAGTDAVTGALVSNSRQAKTKLSAALVSSFYRLWTGEQRRAAIHVPRKRIFTGISMDRHGESDVSSLLGIFFLFGQGLIGSYRTIMISHDLQRGVSKIVHDGYRISLETKRSNRASRLVSRFEILCVSKNLRIEERMRRNGFRTASYS